MQSVQRRVHPPSRVHIAHERAQVRAPLHMQLLRLPVHQEVQLPAARQGAPDGQEIRV